MMKKIVFVIAVMAIVAALGGCSLLNFDAEEPSAAEPSVITNGTTTGNILNYGFGVQYGDELIFRFSSEGAYPLGSIVRSNPETGDNSLVLSDGGLYMSIVNDYLYYCRADGVYKTALDTPAPTLVLEADVSQLQIVGGNMYYIENGAIDSNTLFGESRDFAQIDNAQCLNVYEQMIYYIDTTTGHIWRANMDGTGATVFFEQSVNMFYILNDDVYFIDGVTGYIQTMPMDTKEVLTIVAFACYGFNVNQNDMYYTRNVGSISTCCIARPDGSEEETIDDFGDSDWHIACMWNDGAIIARIEDVLGS